MYASIVLYIEHNCKETNTLKGMKMLNNFICTGVFITRIENECNFIDEQKIILLHFTIIFALKKPARCSCSWKKASSWLESI